MEVHINCHAQNIYYSFTLSLKHTNIVHSLNIRTQFRCLMVVNTIPPQKNYAQTNYSTHMPFQDTQSCEICTEEFTDVAVSDNSVL